MNVVKFGRNVVNFAQHIASFGIIVDKFIKTLQHSSPPVGF